MNLQDIPNVTFSPESAAGPSPLHSPAGRQLDLFGPEAVPASRSAAPESNSHKPTSATSGPCSSALSASAALCMSLGNRLQARLARVGSMEYRQTWKQKATPLGRLYWAHTASARPISDSGFTGWPTPRTPTGGAESADRKQELGRTESGGSDLAATAQLAGWPTPEAEEARRGFQNRNNGKKGSQKSLTTVAVESLAQLSGPTQSESSAKTEKPAAFQLNPRFSLWLMGFPAEWAFCGARAMQSCRKSPRSS